MLKKIIILFSIGVSFGALMYAPISQSASVVGSKHDLSTTGSDEQVCSYCHTPHFANTTIAAPLWNRVMGADVTFTMYSSPTIDSTVSSQPTGVSIACLGCHDAVLAYDRTLRSYAISDKHDVVNAPGSGGMPDTTTNPNCESCHWGNTNWRLGNNLSNDHPISLAYPTAEQDPAFFTPPNAQKGWSDVPLYGGKVECPSCHNVHDRSLSPFLRIANTASALCYKCHKK